MAQSQDRVSFDHGTVTVSPQKDLPRPPGAGSPLTFRPENAALVVVDMQQGFLQLPPFAAAREIVPSVAKLLSVARASGITVVHLITEFGEGMPDAGRAGSRTRQMMLGLGAEDSNPLLRGSATAEIVPDLKPMPGDLVVTKTRFSGFWGSKLDEVLRSRGIDTLIFAGATTTVCVESTVRDALFLEYNCLVVSDCTADITLELRDSALARVEMFFGWTCASDDLADALRG